MFSTPFSLVVFSLEKTTLTSMITLHIPNSSSMKPYHRWVFLKCVLNLGIIWVCVLESGRGLYDSHFSLWKRTHKLGCGKIRAYLGKFSKIISNKFYIIVLSLNSFDFKHFICYLVFKFLYIQVFKFHALYLCTFIFHSPFLMSNGV